MKIGWTHRLVYRLPQLVAYNGAVSDSSAVNAVLFDYGVVLTGPPDPAAWAAMLTITRLSETEFERAYWAPRHDYDRGFLTGTEYWQATGKQAGLELSDQHVAELIDADNALWTGMNQPMVDWAARLQATRTPTGVLSNLGDALTEGVLARQTWLSGFDHLVWSHSLKLAKPDPEIYRVAAQGFGYEPRHILFIDDRENNVSAGIAAGMQAILYTSQIEFELELVRLGLGHLWATGILGSGRP